ncbi:DUF5107 domain-containing protein [Olivibacter sp. XZL3]|uniref:DUF5107 domain-containing protein n=1 Tax=Olivibacter sp. XZL3 TaxID=1735116 RepID=UPI001066BC1C|nr:DUF5107 domain-containing protein [Olivibacter sp. XZL3]
MIKSMLVSLLTILPVVLYAQQAASIKETTQRYVTYPFSDPDPIPASRKIYPYFRFDGFAQKPIQKNWKIVELENDFIKVRIMPEIGGKIWSAFDKVAQKDFIYNNEVVKFRDIAMRGPWTSGGIEANYGIIGHTPNTSTPVDYLTQQHEDGSVSCFISALDLLTRTRWTLEIKLEKDKRYFSTRSFWSNTNPMEQPYYTWMNLGVPAADDLQFLYPGDHYIGHDGKSHPWPIDEQGRNLSYYRQNNFDGSKSYHVLGTHSRYFSAYWKNQDYGMLRIANREDKLGKKIFLWAQSGEGKIWEQLLTDNSGQYVEIQSGRLFNQNMFESSFTPFKQIDFKPYQTDTWIEYWFPYQGIGAAQAASLLGTFSSKKVADKLILNIDPNQALADSLFIYDENEKLIQEAFIQTTIGKPISLEITGGGKTHPKKVKIRQEVLDLLESSSSALLQRPLELPETMDTGSVYGLYLQGRDRMRLRFYKEAEPKIAQSLAKDGSFVPALVEMAKLQWTHMHYDSTFYYAKKALSIDTYHGEANYYYGLAAAKLGKSYDAMDGFEVASLDPTFQSAAYTALSKAYVVEKDYHRAFDYAQKALGKNADNIEALQLQYLSTRHAKQEVEATAIAEAIRLREPLNHFIRFESYFQDPSAAAKDHFVSLIRNELPMETYLELAIWYANIKEFDAAKEVLSLSPLNIEGLYWLAWLCREQDAEKDKWLQMAEAADLKQVFPFREESAAVFAWASAEKASWKANYLEALVHIFRNNEDTARVLLGQVKDPVDFAPFYVTRARLYQAGQEAVQRRDLQQAIQLDREEWRYGQLFARFLSRQKMYTEAIATIKPYYEHHPANYVIGLDYIRVLLLNKEFLAAEKVLKAIQILPFEGATDGRKYYEQTKLMLALQALQRKEFGLANQKVREAQQWPSNLGVGEPYENLKDQQLVRWVAAQICNAKGEKEQYQRLLLQIVQDQAHRGASVPLKIAALKALGKASDAAIKAKEWLADQTNTSSSEAAKTLAQHALLQGNALDLNELISFLLIQEDRRLF